MIGNCLSGGFVILLFAFLFASFSAQAQLPINNELNEKRIFGVLPGTSHVFWKIVQNGIEKAAQDAGYKTLIRAGRDESQYQKQNVQLQLINYAIKNGAHYIIIAPSPTKDKNIEVPKAEYIFAGRPSDEFTLPFKGRALVAIDSVEAGRSGAKSLKSTLPKGSKVGVFNVDLKVQGTNLRVKGFVSEAKKLGYKVAFNIPIGYGIREAQAEAKKYLIKYPDTKAVFTPNEASTASVIRAINEMSKDKRPLHVGFDFRTDFADNLRRGDLHSLVVQDPFLIGYKCAEAVIKLEKKQSIEKKIKIATFILSRFNIDEPKMKERLKFYYE